MMTAAQMAEDMAFGGQRVATKQAFPAQRASGGMRISQRKKNKKTDAKMDVATLPNQNLGEKVTEVDLGLVKVPTPPPPAPPRGPPPGTGESPASRNPPAATLKNPLPFHTAPRLDVCLSRPRCRAAAAASPRAARPCARCAARPAGWSAWVERLWKGELVQPFTAAPLPCAHLPAPPFSDAPHGTQTPEASSAIFQRTIQKRLRSQTPKVAQGYNFKPNMRAAGPLNQPRPGF